MELQEIALSPLLREHKTMAAQHLSYIDYVLTGDHKTAMELGGRFFQDVTRQFEAPSRSTRPLDSVAEGVFLVWWQAITGWYDKVPIVAEPQRQVSIGGVCYRLDFVIEPAGQWDGPWRPIAVEIDGHAFHERTREQVNYRNQRDRALLLDGWCVLHFSYEELVQQPARVVAEVFTVASRQWRQATGLPVENADIQEPPF